MRAWIESNRTLMFASALVLPGFLVLAVFSHQIGFLYGYGTMVGAAPASPTAIVATQTPTATATPTSTATRTPTLRPSLTPTPAPTTTGNSLPSRVLPVPVIQQELPLSCEIAGMRMMAAGLLGHAPAEAELLACISYDANPYLGFRGDPAGSNRMTDGSINWDNYGMYAPAVADALNRCLLAQPQTPFKAVAASHVTYEQVARSILDGYPVLVWVAKQDQAVGHMAMTDEGPVQLVFGEHVWVVMAYHEDGTFDVHDPYPQKSGNQTFRVSSFVNWERFDRMAVFLVPSVTPVNGQDRSP